MELNKLKILIAHLPESERFHLQNEMERLQQRCCMANGELAQAMICYDIAVNKIVQQAQIEQAQPA